MSSFSTLILMVLLTLLTESKLFRKKKKEREKYKDHLFVGNVFFSSKKAQKNKFSCFVL